MGDSCFYELQLDGFDAAVIHIAGGHTMGARFRVGYSDVADSIDGEAIVEAAVVTQDPAVPVIGVLAEADVCDNEEGGEVQAKELDCLDDGAFRVVCCSS